jgi:hypothetical protein
MERVSKKMSFKVPEIETVTATSAKTTISTISRWVPLICAGAAAGVSMIALKEIKNVRRELITLKKEQAKPVNDELGKRMQAMEDQLKILSEFIKNKESVSKESVNVIRNAVKPPGEAVKIINGEEYEEVEVTDDEDEEIEEPEK